MAALANCLLDNRMQRRFQRQPLARAIDLLLQERVPVSVLQFQPQDDGVAAPPVLPITAGPVSRQISTPHTAVPCVTCCPMANTRSWSRIPAGLQPI